MNPALYGMKGRPRIAIFVLLTLAVNATPAIGDTDQGVGPATGGPLAMRPLTVNARIDKLFFYPCNDCHAFMDSNDSIRDLDVEEGHPEKLQHGSGLIWCFSCHDESDYDQLRDLRAEPLDIDRGYQVCGGCHSQKYRDWAGGAHGKRVADWRGERRIFSCVECHNPHHPAIQPRPPKPPPPVRAGLEAMTPDEGLQPRDPVRPELEHTDVR